MADTYCVLVPRGPRDTMDSVRSHAEDGARYGIADRFKVPKVGITLREVAVETATLGEWQSRGAFPIPHFIQGAMLKHLGYRFEYEYDLPALEL